MAEDGRAERIRKRSDLSEDIHAAQVNFKPELLTLLESKPYERAYSKCLRDGISTGDVRAVSTLEQEFNLAPHTFSVFALWKRKQPQELVCDVKSGNARMAEQRRKKQKADEDVRKAQHLEYEEEKRAAADAIASSYKRSKSGMILFKD